MSRVASWCLLRKITKHASLLYLCIFEKVYEKAREESVKSCWKYRKWCRYFENYDHHASYCFPEKKTSSFLKYISALKYWQYLKDIYLLVENGNKNDERFLKSFHINHLAAATFGPLTMRQPHSFDVNYNYISSSTQRSLGTLQWGWVPKAGRVHQWVWSRKPSDSECNMLSQCAILSKSALENNWLSSC